ncbi:hypothetical protein N658DRAFT_509356 [Parathielavia hyrcaniae]|uniref:Uncharacterized protein n=1 Tax=Parathielavia hyrcaniae TaxID=113614 RepID=A0AAN6PZ28_9PEZI|nr:hypothetical protein N658DRAFT_509356 [Parathielavia hyrcaniae]
MAQPQQQPAFQTSQAQASHPMLINPPGPPSNPDTPSEMPGTPTSTTTSLSGLSTTAIKDGHRGALHRGGHQHSPSAANTLEAERADRISRLAGLSTVSTLRPLPLGPAQHSANPSHAHPASAGLAANTTAAAAAGGLTPAYFDAAGQPVAATKVSTVGSASETESLGGNTSTTTEGGGGDGSTLGEDRDEDMLAELDSASASGYAGGAASSSDAMDEDLDHLASRSLGGFEDRMSDDGSASLVGFGEGAGSTLSGPIYHRRPLPAGATALGGLKRSSSGLSSGEGGAAAPPPHSSSSGASGGRRDFATHVAAAAEREAGAETPVSQSAVRERREARMVDGVAMEAGAPAAEAQVGGGTPEGRGFVDTTTRGPVPVQPPASTNRTAATTVRERRQPSGYHHHQPAAQTPHTAPPSSSQEVPERAVRDRLDDGEGRVESSAALGSPRARERLGRVYFEDR